MRQPQKPQPRRRRIGRRRPAEDDRREHRRQRQHQPREQRLVGEQAAERRQLGGLAPQRPRGEQRRTRRGADQRQGDEHERGGRRLCRLAPEEAPRRELPQSEKHERVAPLRHRHAPQHQRRRLRREAQHQKAHLPPRRRRRAAAPGHHGQQEARRHRRQEGLRHGECVHQPRPLGEQPAREQQPRQHPGPAEQHAEGEEQPEGLAPQRLHARRVLLSARGRSFAGRPGGESERSPSSDASAPATISPAPSDSAEFAHRPALPSSRTCLHARHGRCS